MTGHMLGAAGAVEFIVGALAIARRHRSADDQLRDARSRAAISTTRRTPPCSATGARGAQQQLRLRRAQRHARHQALRGVAPCRRPSQLDRRLISDPALRPIADKVERGERLYGGRRRRAVRQRRPARRRPHGRCGESREARRPRDLRGEPAHQSDEHLHAAEDLRLLLVRASAEGRGRVSLHDGAGVRRSGDGEQHDDARVPHRRRPRHEGGARVLQRDVPRAQGALSARAHQGAHRGRDRAHRAHRARCRCATR